MNDDTELQRLYAAIALDYLKGKISRDDYKSEIIALRNHPAAMTLSYEQRETIIKKAVEQAEEILDEVYFSESGKWQ